MIPFNKPYTTGAEVENIRQSIQSGHLSGNGPFTKRCHKLLEEGWGFDKVLLTTSCTDALEMAALLIDIKPDDEVIIPSYTFVSTALAFARQGARIVFADSLTDDPCVDPDSIERLITQHTVAIVPVHYGGMSCDIDKIMNIAEKHDLFLIEDTAHAFGSRYRGKLLGTFGHLGCFSFHETKLIHCGEGGMLAVNDTALITAAEQVWEKGTNRCAFYRGEISRYEWVSHGSSFLMSDISAAFLLAQLTAFDEIAGRRREQWLLYETLLYPLKGKGLITLPVNNNNTLHNHSMYHLVARSENEREALRSHLVSNEVQALSHYPDLSGSPFIASVAGQLPGQSTPNSSLFQERLLRLPLWHSLENQKIEEICRLIHEFYD